MGAHARLLDGDHLADHICRRPELGDVPGDDVAVVLIGVGVMVANVAEHGLLLLILGELGVVGPEAEPLVPRGAGVAADAGRPDGLADVALVQDAAEYDEEDQGGDC